MEGKGFDQSVVLFHHKALPVRINCSDNILPFQVLANEIGFAIGFNIPMGVYFSNKGNFLLGNRKAQMALLILIVAKGKVWRKMAKGSPDPIPENAWVASPMISLPKSTMRLLIMVILQKTPTGSAHSLQRRGGMPSQNPSFPKTIKALYGRISSRFPLGNENQVDPHKQMQTNDLRKTVGIASSSSGRHFIVNLRNLRDSHGPPCLEQMLTQRNGLFIGKMANPSRLPHHVDRMERIKARHHLGSSKIDRPNKIGLLQIAQSLGPHVRIGPAGRVSQGSLLPSFAQTRKNTGNRRNRRDLLYLPLLQFPLDNLGTHPRKGRSPAIVRCQPVPDGQNLLDNPFWGFSPNSPRGTALILQPLFSLFVISTQPLRKPTTISLDSLQDFIKAISPFIQLNSLPSFLIFIPFFHRLFSFPKILGRSLGDLKKSSRCY